MLNSQHQNEQRKYAVEVQFSREIFPSNLGSLIKLWKAPIGITTWIMSPMLNLMWMPSIMVTDMGFSNELRTQFRQSSSLGFEMSCSAVSTGTQECLSAQAGPIGIILILREKNYLNLTGYKLHRILWLNQNYSYQFRVQNSRKERKDFVWWKAPAGCVRASRDRLWQQ